MARPAKNTPVPTTDDKAIDTEKFQTAHGAMAEQAREREFEIAELAHDVGAIQMADLASNFLRAAKVRLFERVRESNQIKHLPIRTPDGLRPAKDIQEFCHLVFGKSYTVLFEAQQTLDKLGEEAYDIADRLGLNRNALRAARALPPEKLETVRLAIANGSSKAEVLSVIEDLAVKVEQANKIAAEAQAEKAASDELVTKKSQKIDALTKQLRKIEKLPTGEALTDLRKEAGALAADAEGAVLGGLRQAVKALAEAHIQHGEQFGDQMVFAAGLVGQVQAQLNAIRAEFNLPDVSSAADQQLAAEVAQWGKA